MRFLSLNIQGRPTDLFNRVLKPKKYQSNPTFRFLRSSLSFTFSDHNNGNSTSPYPNWVFAMNINNFLITHSTMITPTIQALRYSDGQYLGFNLRLLFMFIVLICVKIGHYGNFSVPVCIVWRHFHVESNLMILNA